MVMPENADRTGRDESPNERADRNWNDLLQELRVVQTGTVLISGFLLAVAFQSRFAELDPYQLGLYLVLVALAAGSTLLGLAQVMVHRTHFARLRKSDVVRAGGRLLAANVIVVIGLTAGVTSLIFDFTLDRTAGFVALAAVLVVGAALWVVLAPRRG